MGKTRFPWIVMACCFLPGGFLFGQTAAPNPATSPVASPTQISSLTLTFEQGQQALAQSLNALFSQGATGQQLQAWRTQNASALAVQHQEAMALAAAAASQPLPYVGEVQIPDGASQEMSDLLTTRADLYNKYAALYNQQLSSGTTANVISTYQQQNAAEIQAQRQRSQDIAAQAASQPLPMQPPLVIPDGASPQLSALLTLHDQIVRDKIALLNQYTTATPAERSAALQQWQQQNAALLHQQTQLAQNLSASTAN